MPIEILNSGVDLSGEVEIVTRNTKGVIVKNSEEEKKNGQFFQSSKSKKDLHLKCEPYQPIGNMDSVFNLKILRVIRDDKGKKQQKKKQIKLKSRTTEVNGIQVATETVANHISHQEGGWDSPRQNFSPEDVQEARQTVGGGVLPNHHKTRSSVEAILGSHLGTMIKHKHVEKVLASRGLSGGYNLVRERLEVDHERLKSLRARGVLATHTKTTNAKETALWAIDDIRKKGHNQTVLYEVPSLDNYSPRTPRLPCVGQLSPREQARDQANENGRFGGSNQRRIFQNQLQKKLDEYDATRAERIYQMDHHSLLSFAMPYPMPPARTQKGNQPFRGRPSRVSSPSHSVNQTVCSTPRRRESSFEKQNQVSAAEPTRPKSARPKAKGAKLEEGIVRTTEQSLKQVSSLVGTLQGFTARRRDLDSALNTQLKTMDFEWSHTMEIKFAAFNVSADNSNLEKDLKLMYEGTSEKRREEINEKRHKFSWYERMMQNLREYMRDQPFPPRMVEFIAAVRAILFLSRDGTGEEMSPGLFYDLCKMILEPEDHKHRGIQRMLRLVRKALDINVNNYIDWLKERDIEVPTQVVQWAQNKTRKKAIKRRIQRSLRKGNLTSTKAVLILHETEEENSPNAISAKASSKRDSVLSVASNRKNKSSIASSLNLLGSSRIMTRQATIPRQISTVSTSLVDHDSSEDDDSCAYDDTESVMDSIFEA